ncbi:MAG: thiamine pyrophosphate-dependent enzyme [Vicinamibacterales bacterium]
MECISVCPDTALPNCAQDLSTLLHTAVSGYVTDPAARRMLLGLVPEIDRRAHEAMRASLASKAQTPLAQLLHDIVDEVATCPPQATRELFAILDHVPMAYQKVNAIFATSEKRQPGSGGIFSIFVSDLCKGCAACVTACGEHQALRMVQETEDVNAAHETGTAFLDLLPDTPQKYLGLYDGEHPQDSKTATLRNLLMVRRNYDAFVSGDGACAGCGEKSILRSIASVTEAYMRPVYRDKADRLVQTAERLARDGVARLDALQASDENGHALFRQAVAHLILGLGGENEADTRARMNAHGPIDNAALVEALVAVLRQDAFNHRSLQSVDGRLANGMAVMAMAAHTGCNTVYGSTPPNNPHPYPWMNSLFQDGATIGWLIGESFIVDHARRSVIPERLATALLTRDAAVVTAEEYYAFSHFSDGLMTDREIVELPKVWVVGGDGGMGDIGFQNNSKMLLQNRPNVKALMLDTQVYSNTGGQNSDSTPMLGGNDMNVFGAATQGKASEKKAVAEAFLGGHGSPFVAQISIANAPKLYRAILDALEYRGTAFLQCFTTCQPEHGVGDDMALTQAQRVRDSRSVPEFVYNPRLGESYAETLDLKGNPAIDRDWYESKTKGAATRLAYTVAHWAATEARFRNHFKKVGPEQAASLISLENMLVRITQNDVVYRRHLDETHRAFVPDFGVYITLEGSNGAPQYRAISRQLVLFCVERRKAWRLLQSRAGIVNRDYQAQRTVLAGVDAGTISRQDLLTRGHELVRALVDGPVSQPSTDVQRTA